MRNIHAANTRESYKILAASDAHIDPSEGRNYRQGHVFIAGEEDGQRKTIGYSSGGKVWSSTSEQIPELLDWCKALGAKIRSDGTLVTNSGLDYLDAGRVVDAIPENLVYVEWDKSAYDYNDPATIQYVGDDGATHRGHILDLELSLDREHTDATRVRVNVIGEGIQLPIEFSLEEWYLAPAGGEERITVTRGTSSTSMLEYLSENYLQFFTADHALLSGNELFAPKAVVAPIAVDQLQVWDWEGVNIEQEVTAANGIESVHDRVRRRLEQGDAAVVVYDHGSGEVADYLAIGLYGDTVCFDLYHCKGSGGAAPGARIGDLYEVCGQAQKSVALASVSKLERRLRDRRPLTYVRGNDEALETLIGRAKNALTRFTITIVQPGVSKGNLSVPMGECLGATNSHLIKLGIEPLIVATSA